MAKTGISLWTANTPNGVKITIALEELGLPYTIEPLDMSKQEQKAEPFLAVNPNGRIPAIVDHDNGGLSVWESGSILIYLAEKYGKGKLLPTDDKGRADTISWLMWQMAGQGPMQGQVNYFTHAFPTREPATIQRFLNESKRLYGVLDEQLSKHAYVAGDTYTIADIAIIGWALSTPMAGIDLLEYPHVDKWARLLRARPAVLKGYNTPVSRDPPLRARVTAAWDDLEEHKKLVAEAHAKQARTE